MKLLLIMYSGSRSRLVPDMLDAHGVRGYTRLQAAQGAGETGRREGSRAWPGSADVFFSVVAAGEVDVLTRALGNEVIQLTPDERLHVAVLPTESFF